MTRTQAATELEELRERIAKLESDSKRVAVVQQRPEPVRTEIFRFAAPIRKNVRTGDRTAKYVARQRGRFSVVEEATSESIQSTPQRRVFANNEELTRDEAIAFLKAGFSVHIESRVDGARTGMRTADTVEELDEPGKEH